MPRPSSFARSRHATRNSSEQWCGIVGPSAGLMRSRSNFQSFSRFRTDASVSCVRRVPRLERLAAQRLGQRLGEAGDRLVEGLVRHHRRDRGAHAGVRVGARHRLDALRRGQRELGEHVVAGGAALAHHLGGADQRREVLVLERAPAGRAGLGVEVGLEVVAVEEAFGRVRSARGCGRSPGPASAHGRRHRRAPCPRPSPTPRGTTSAIEPPSTSTSSALASPDGVSTSAFWMRIMSAARRQLPSPGAGTSPRRRIDLEDRRTACRAVSPLLLSFRF